jgi:hypothetical protein
VREQSVVALAPLILFAFWRFESARTARLAVAMLLAAGLGLAWFVPMVQTSGGLGTYLKIGRLHAALNAPDTLGGGGIEALLNNVAAVSRSCWNGLLLGAVVLVVALLYRILRMTAERKSEWHRQHAHALSVLGIWVVPMMLLGTVIGFTKQPGYVLNYLPGWFVLTGAVAASLPRARQRVATLAAICAVNVVVFTAWPPQWDGIFFGMGRTARDISEHDAQLSRIVATVRGSYSPKEAVICHADEYYLYGIRHFQLYLPEYDQYQLAIDMTTLHPPGKPMWRARDGCLEFVDKLPVDGGKEIVLFVPPGEDVAIFAPYFPPATLDSLAKRAIR